MRIAVPVKEIKYGVVEMDIEIPEIYNNTIRNQRNYIRAKVDSMIERDPSVIKWSNDQPSLDYDGGFITLPDPEEEEERD